MKKIISMILAFSLLLTIPFMANSNESAFTDVSPDSEYFEAVTALNEIYPLGYGDKTFKPENYVTRAEFVTMLIKILMKPEFSEKNLDQIFMDVPVSSWASRYITLAYGKGLVNGYGDGIFDPESTVKYEEMIKITVSYLLGGRIYGISYPDGFIDIAKDLGIAELKLEIGENAERWQVAALLYNAINIDKEKLSEAKEEYSSEYESYGGMPTGGSGGGSISMTMAPPMAMAESSKVSADYSDSEPVRGGTPAITGDSLIPAEDIVVEIPGVIPEPMPTAVPVDEGYYNQQIHAGMLTAGEWNDNRNWDYWNRLMANREWYNLQGKWKISTNRYVILVKDGETPIIGAKVTLSQGGSEIWTAITDKNGNAVIFITETPDEQSNEFSLTVSTSSNNVTVDNVTLTDDKPYEVEITENNLSDSIDLMFMIDTTGSMGDELQYIKEELTDVIERIEADVRVSCNFYRDIQDEYIVRSFNFTTDINEAVDQIAGQRATGGGDFPEAVEVALNNAIFEHEWNENAKERFLFLVLDAPPHHDEERVAKINENIKEAAKKGIRIIPVASSGIDKETEFLLRGMSIATNGTYLFLTNHSGIGNSHIEPTIGSYDVEFLNDLIVKVINDRI